ncbi:MAG: FGGY-family carbohydrate kinase [Armatimonadetes bacterium]|nr:FGGY-family carbohydrate kinase [Armatimonadota bacterium]
MADVKYVIGVDISTQTISAMLIGVEERGGSPSVLAIPNGGVVSRRCAGSDERGTPSVWVGLVRDCIEELKRQANEAKRAVSIGVCTAFPGAFPIARDGSIDPRAVSLYDNTDDAGIGVGDYEEALGRAEARTLNRMAAGNMAVGLAGLVKSGRLDMEQAAAIVPPNSAFAYALLGAAGVTPDPHYALADYTQTVIGGLYDARTGAPVANAVAELLCLVVPGINVDILRQLLPTPSPSWRNVLSSESTPAVRALLGLPDLTGISIGAGDSPAGALALPSDPDTVVCVRGSSDSPMLMIDAPRGASGMRENVLHYPLPTVTSLADSPWCAVAPTLRSGRVWDWVKRLRFDADDANADSVLEAMALEAFEKRLRARKDSPESSPLMFDTALGGERAPDWDPHATGSITGLVLSHTLGDIALAALEGVSRRLSACIDLMEERYGRRPAGLLLVGGPARNVLWNRLTQAITGKETLATTFADASVLGAALIGYATAYDGAKDDRAVSARLRAASELSARNPLVRPFRVGNS